MRILLAVDGSVSSDRATQVVSSLPLPPKSVVRVVSVQQPFTDVLDMSWATTGTSSRVRVETQQEADARHRHEAISRAEIELARSDLRVDGFLLRGRPARSIVDEASSMDADLIVLGSRGHSAIATMVLGSTASDVVDHAPCPVLVVRSASLGPIVFATTGRRAPAPPRRSSPPGRSSPAGRSTS